MRAHVLSSGLTSVWTTARDKQVRATREMPRADRWIWFGVLALITLGTVMVLSSSVMIAERRFGEPGFFWKRQIVWSVLAMLMMVVVSRFDYRHLRKLILPGMLVSIALLIAVLFTNPINEARRWLSLGLFSVQPSELFRLGMIVFTAAYVAKQGEKIERPWTLWPLGLVLAVGVGLIMAQPEFSGIITLCSCVGIILIAAGLRWRHVLPVAVLAVVLGCTVVFGFGYKKGRVDEWQKGLTGTGGSYQVRQSKIAFGSGGTLGQGLGHGRAKMLYLPEPHTDFILASVGEELGLVGISGVLFIVTGLILRAWRVATRAPDRFGYLLVIGIGGSLFVNAGLNAAVVTGLVPATGLPFPFLSYGGSSLVTTAAAWGIVLNVSRYRTASW